ncbi:hypothetical protein B0H67DRAFT_667096 [Lasiosphaeris hirsuta]|uniref:Uncharacterized protein n=1 Tax=Lasiosphaeris hirsuta TaxID=260670 RepID=A0AA40AI88_9PEZI|nr:hypothetical protein B0H67DRAFT_667096 [Lasiosphaeris hirsuta]
MSENIYVTPPSIAHVNLKPFDLPTDKGTVWAVAFGERSSAFMNGAISVAFGLIFPWLWGLIAALVLYSWPHHVTRRQSAALVVLCNAVDPWSAFKEFSAFTMDSWSSTECTKWYDFTFGFIFALLGLSVYVVAIVMGIIGPPLLQIGNFAPVRASELYYPKIPLQATDLQKAYYHSLFAASALRALSSVEIAKSETRSKADITQVPVAGDGNTGLAYTYWLTGVDLGLAHGPELRLEVEGACRTEYSWVNTADPYWDHHKYWPVDGNFSSGKGNFWVALNGTPISFPPRVNIELHPNITAQLQQDGNVSYAVSIASAHRSSPQAGSDPWYITEIRNTSDSESLKSNYNFRVKRGRPVLSCWQQDKWSLRGQTLRNIFDLRNAPGVQIPDVLLDILESTFASPAVQTIGNVAGFSALASVVTSPSSTRGVIDAEQASVLKDMERLILASLVSSRSTFVDTTLFKPNDNQANLFIGSDSMPRDGSDRFVVASPRVQTFYLSGLILLASFMATFLLLKTLLWVKLSRHSHEHPSTQINNDRWARFGALSAGQLLRNIYERREGLPEEGWKCCESLPDPVHDNKPRKGPEYNLFQLVQCKKDDCSCSGHIAIKDIPEDKPEDKPAVSKTGDAQAATQAAAQMPDSEKQAGADVKEERV